MTDFSKGIIEINGFTFRPGTTIDEVKGFFGENVRTLELSTGPRIKFLSRAYLSESIYAYAFDFSEDGILKTFSLHPEVPSTVIDRGYGEIPKYKLEIAKIWLEKMLKCAPNTSNESCVFYKFENVDYFSSTTKDIHYGLVGGEIDITFHGV